ncbi:MAG: VWA domain-containing protein [Proteobacteria bacterium]|nr:VWA domain-containing protein [Pseudomonadota bacterium]
MKPRTTVSVRGPAPVLALVLTLVPSLPAAGYGVKMSVELSHGVLEANRRQHAFLKVGLIGDEVRDLSKRAAVNVALVLDRSGSMTGRKLEHAKRAAIQALDGLGPQDIVSVVAYDTTVEVLVPATKLRDRAAVYRRIAQLRARGTTALFAGVSKGAHEVLKFLDGRGVNRVILLSDGLANVGPSSPGALAGLGSSLAKNGITVSTIGLGLGYNEDLMYRLAGASDGNHVFVEREDQLPAVFAREFGDMFAVVAGEVEVRIRCGVGIRPLRVLGRSARIVGDEVSVRLSQLQAAVQKYVLLEVEVDPQPAGKAMTLAAIALRYRRLDNERTEQQSGQAQITFSAAGEAIAASANRAVAVAALEQLANDATKQAVELRDAGRIAEARVLLKKNVGELKASNKVLKSKQLDALEKDIAAAAERVDQPAEVWQRTRKAMRGQQRRVESQQAF